MAGGSGGGGSLPSRVGGGNGEGFIATLPTGNWEGEKEQLLWLWEHLETGMETGVPAKGDKMFIISLSYWCHCCLLVIML